MFTILLVEDDEDLRALYGAVLADAGYCIAEASSGQHALEVFRGNRIDMVITDVMMPGIDGFELTRRLREHAPDLPILTITALGETTDKQAGFKSGTDDYMVKPIDLNEMVWRVEALLRRSRIETSRTVRLGSTVLDYDSLTVRRSGEEPEELPLKEFLLLYKLAASPNRIFTRKQIVDEVWGEGIDAAAHTLDVHISRLRERFKGNKDFEIVTARGLGYKVVLR